jgi:WD40 repeat protein
MCTQVFLYEGGEGEVVGELVDAAIKGSVAHAGGVYSLAWTPDGSRILTASGDKTCKLWNVDAKSLLA